MRNLVYTIIVTFLVAAIINADLALDRNWMSFLDPSLRINQIHIPGTHDSGTYSMLYGSKPFSETQVKNITEQLNTGIRYFDIRLGFDNIFDDMYLSHTIACRNRSFDILYLSDVLNEFVNFLKVFDTETIIAHFSLDRGKVDVDEATDYDFGSMLAKETIYNEKFSEYFYDNKGTKIFPTLDKVKGKIFILTSWTLHYDTLLNKNLNPKTGWNTLGYPMRGSNVQSDCENYNLYENDGNVCLPAIIEHFRIQDTYNLKYPDKWYLVNDMLNNKIGSRNITGGMLGKENLDTNDFYNPVNPNLLTLNYLNIAKATSITNAILTGLFTSSIANSAISMNTELLKYISNIRNKHLYPIPNEWTIMDFPSLSIIRAIYSLNDLDYSKDTGDIQLEKFELSVLGKITWTDVDHYIVQTKSKSGKRGENNNNAKACLQRKLLIDKENNQHDLVKTNYVCVENELNQWRIKMSDEGKFYSIISTYDNKCLSYSDNNWTIQKCKNNNKDEDFIIKEGKICARADESQCLDGSYDLIPAISKPEIYKNLTCSTVFAMHGIKCCSDPNTKVEYVDNIGNWGIENGELCGIGYVRCSFETIGAHCCSSVNPKVEWSDERGTWGYEDNDWCGIGEMIYDTKVRIRNRKTKSCLITNLHSDTNIVLLGDCNHSIWTYENNKLVLEATSKCLYAMNSKDARMTGCDEGDNEINHQIHFNIIDNKYICIKNDEESGEICLYADGKTANFQTSKSETSEWYIEHWNGKIVDSIDEVIRNNPSLKLGEFKPSYSSKTDESDLLPTCFSEALGYPCCPPEVTDVAHEDDDGKWGIYNGDWCGMIDSTTTATSTPIPTPTPPSDPNCPFQDFPCCSPENIEVTYTDNTGDWGVENETWCHILNNNVSTTPTPNPIIPRYRCGANFNNQICPNNECCSYKGYCGTTKAYCGSNCQSEFGKCGLSATPNNAEIKWFYNSKNNQCLSAQKNLNKKPKISTCLNDDNFQWIVYPSPKGYFHPKSNPEWCMNLLDVENGKIKVGNCTDNSIFEYTADGLIKSPLSPDECLGKGDRNGDSTNDGGYLKSCVKSPDQIWSAWDVNPVSLFDAKTQDIWVYNSELNKCLLSGSALTDRPVIGNCDNSNSSKWQISESEDGFYKSLKTGWYLDVTNINQGTIIMTDTRNPSSVIKHSKKRQAIVSSLNSKKCLGIMSSNKKNENRLTLNDCNDSKNDQHWEIRKTFPSSN